MLSSQGRRRPKYDNGEISALLAKVLEEIGPERFAGLKLLELERLIRKHDPDHRLPGRTLLRASINSFRVARWLNTAPLVNKGQA